MAGALLALAALPAAAHHTFAMFDASRIVTLHGTLKEFQWTNPHCFLQVSVPKNGVTTEWSVQMNAPLDLYRVGWRPHTLQPGDSITVQIKPSRDGRHSGAYVGGTGPDGKALKGG